MDIVAGILCEYIFYVKYLVCEAWVFFTCGNLISGLICNREIHIDSLATNNVIRVIILLHCVHLRYIRLLF